VRIRTLRRRGAAQEDLLDCGRELQAAFGGALAVASLRAPLRAQWGGYCWFEARGSGRLQLRTR
jgi:hypothetical protein